MAKDLFEGLDPPTDEQDANTDEQSSAPHSVRTYTADELSKYLGVSNRTPGTRWLPNILAVHPWIDEQDLVVRDGDRITAFTEQAFDLLCEYQELRATKIPKTLDGEILRNSDGSVFEMVENPNRVAKKEYLERMWRKPRPVEAEQGGEQPRTVEVAGIASPIVHIPEQNEPDFVRCADMIVQDAKDGALNAAEELTDSVGGLEKIVRQAFGSLGKTHGAIATEEYLTKFQQQVGQVSSHVGSATAGGEE
ncbi:MAG: hypothetical protein F6J87_14875 [Spirulina sp. SIO3F2]|nr:hypothetical protein [Spirulina sp. SIO3F2]